MRMQKMVCSYRGPQVHNRTLEYAVYSCSRDSWKIFKHNINCNRNTDCVGSLYNTTYLNGSYYWLLTEKPTWNILSFDFGKEVFVEIEGPPVDYCIYSWSANLILLDDSVAILNFVERLVIDVWVMIQPGVWNKLVTVNCFAHIKSCYESSLILVTSDSQLLSYNVRTKKTRLLEFFSSGPKQ
ncbi:putative anthocyanin 5-aromatic acyltransferase-like [Capsicum annuum]|nr:putative anthocyanin 5-aromatic acyltransferase-like [Capsicum annuum]